MLFGKKFRSAQEMQKIEEEFYENFRPEELEKGDLPALILAAFLAFLPALLIIAALCLALLLLF
jgi:hypothetical protein